MSTHRNNLRLLDNRCFVMDGGLETTLIFNHGYELPEFAAFPLLEQPEEIKVLHDYYLSYIKLARKHHLGFILESPTWRASYAWGKKLGYNRARLERINQNAISFLALLRTTFENHNTPMVISGCIGPQGDGYQVDNRLSIAEAKDYHLTQIKLFSETEADLISAYTINCSEEAIGITLAAQEADIPAVISFTVETDGRLPSGQPLAEAIREVDRKTANGPIHYMINCAHPTHFKHVLNKNSKWMKRIRGIRANASCKSHAELDDAENLDRGNPEDFGREHIELQALLPNLTIFGGCCGTDHHHVKEICKHIETVH